MRFRTGLSIILATLTVMSAVLCGCSKTPESKQEPKVDTIGPATTVSSEEMSDDELQDALLRLEYMMVYCAADFYADDSKTTLINNKGCITYIGDMDGDSKDELCLGTKDASLVFQINSDREINKLGTVGNVLYVDKDGALWNTGVASGPIDRDTTGANRTFFRWNDKEFERVLQKYTISKNGNIIDTEYSMGEGNTAITEEDFNEYGFEEYNTNGYEFRIQNYDVKYKDALVGQFISYLGAVYDVTNTEADINFDGRNETIIVVNNVLDKWNNKDDFPDHSFHINKNRAVVFVISYDEKNVTFTTYGHNGYLSEPSRIGRNFFLIDDISFFVPNSFDTIGSMSDDLRGDYLNSLKDFLERCDCDKVFFKVADISDIDGEELLCFAQKEGKWTLYIFRFIKGIPVMIDDINLGDGEYAYYLIEYNGELCVLRYFHRAEASSNGAYYSYSYCLYRYSAKGEQSVLVDDELHYTNEDEDATKAAKFFEGLNKFLTFDAVVIYDPFVLTGQQWISKTEIDLGERPQQTEFAENEGEETKTRIGFVEVDTNSWLNFREGAGTDKQKVMVDPANPESFIKLAKGTPVTIIEEITVNDKENPLWYKVQINYGDKTLTGYSSATYIRTQD